MGKLVFIKSLINKIYKLLPLRESLDNGENIHLSDYLDSIKIEANGGVFLFRLDCNDKYITVLNTLQTLSENSFEYRVFRREIFKMLHLLNQIEKSIGGDISD